VASTGDACRGGDDGAQWWRQDGSGRRVTGWRKAPNRASEVVNGKATRRTVAGGERAPITWSRARGKRG
jgi:hypothetical protein